jgi:hypothetical protein
MKTFTKIVAAAALFASTSSLALAQGSVGVGVDAGGSVGVESGSDTGTSVGVDTGVDAGVDTSTGSGGNSGTSVSAGADASGSANANANASNDQTNYGSIVSSLSASSMTTADIEAIDSETEIEVVTLSEIEGSAAENSGAIEAAIEAQSESLSDLTAAIEANAEISAALEAEGFSSDDVVAVTATAEGNLTIIVDDSSN